MKNGCALESLLSIFEGREEEEGKGRWSKKGRKKEERHENLGPGFSQIHIGFRPRKEVSAEKKKQVNRNTQIPRLSDRC